MILLQRKRTPDAVHGKYTGTNKLVKDKELMLARRNQLASNAKGIELNSEYWKTAKEQLKVESFGKCAYCEADAAIVAHGDVEHYRPKSIYWWLAYTYDNYLYACQICNQKYKSDHFPVGPGKRMPEPPVTAVITDLETDQLIGKISPDPLSINNDTSIQNYVNQHFDEKAFLLNPYLDDPSGIFAYSPDDEIRTVRIVPSKPEFQEHVKAAEDYYGINRIELLNKRYDAYKKFRLFKRTVNAVNDPELQAEILEQIEEMKSDKYTFAGMNKYFDKYI